MPTYNERLTANNLKIDEITAIANSLPDADAIEAKLDAQDEIIENLKEALEEKASPPESVKVFVSAQDMQADENPKQERLAVIYATSIEDLVEGEGVYGFILPKNVNLEEPLSQNGYADWGDSTHQYTFSFNASTTLSDEVYKTTLGVTMYYPLNTYYYDMTEPEPEPDPTEIRSVNYTAIWTSTDKQNYTLTTFTKIVETYGGSETPEPIEIDTLNYIDFPFKIIPVFISKQVTTGLKPISDFVKYKNGKFYGMYQYGHNEFAGTLNCLNVVWTDGTQKPTVQVVENNYVNYEAIISILYDWLIDWFSVPDRWISFECLVVRTDDTHYTVYEADIAGGSRGINLVYYNGNSYIGFFANGEQGCVVRKIDINLANKTFVASDITSQCITQGNYLLYAQSLNNVNLISNTYVYFNDGNPIKYSSATPNGRLRFYDLDNNEDIAEINVQGYGFDNGYIELMNEEVPMTQAEYDETLATTEDILGINL